MSIDFITFILLRMGVVGDNDHRALPSTMPRAWPQDARGAFSATEGAMGYDRWETTNPDDEALGCVPQLSDAVLANILNWDDALGLSYTLSTYYANYTEIEHLANAIWRRAQERHQLDKDERS